MQIQIIIWATCILLTLQINANTNTYQCKCKQSWQIQINILKKKTLFLSRRKNTTTWIKNPEFGIEKRKNQFSSCTKVGISFDDDGKTGAISNKQFKASHKNAWNGEEIESAHTGLCPKRALTKMNKNYVIPHSFSLQHTSMSPKTWEVLWVCNNAWWL